MLKLSVRVWLSNKSFCERKSKMQIKRKFPIVRVVIGAILAITIIVLIFILRWMTVPKFEIVGDGMVKIPYGQSYEEQGYIADFRDTNLYKFVSVSDNIDLERPGEYTVEYVLNYENFHQVITRTVRVVDEESPVITLSGNIPGSVCPNKQYEEVGYKATDNYDGDITDRVEREEKNNEVIYTVKDSSGNQQTM